MVKVIGMNSGSLFDRIDAVLVEIENGSDGYPQRPKYIAGNSYDWPKPVAYKEAIKFATLAHATVNGLVNNIPAMASCGMPC